MSSLGIRNVLPYKGANGITVVDNVISLDTSEVINFNGITLNTMQINMGGSINFLNNDGITALTYNYDGVIGYLYDPNQRTVYQISLANGSLIIDKTINCQQDLSCGRIQTTFNNGNSAPFVSIDQLENILPPVPTSTIVTSINGLQLGIGAG